MKVLIASLVLFSLAGCASVPAHADLQSAKEKCISQTKFPRNMPENERLAYMRNVSVPKCMAASGHQ